MTQLQELHEYNRVVRTVRSELRRYRKKGVKLFIITRHDLVPLYNPVQKTHRVPGPKEAVRWIICICKGPDTVVSRKSVIATCAAIGNIVSTIEN